MVCTLQDKEASIPHEELGRSIATVQELQRKHEIFDRELTALGNKVIGTLNGPMGTCMLNSMQKWSIVNRYYKNVLSYYSYQFDEHYLHKLFHWSKVNSETGIEAMF